ncbi:alpha/beta fold hydrolase [Pseudooceanicola sp. C21-150M6]|uniref:alpha/beta fold hydrolase n=1 Tax=Pseudooceanicola sp. C21-150M6 TaxID=3434355 RepID=UPI003D7F1982
MTVVLGGHETATRHWDGGPGRALLVHCSLGHSGGWKGVASVLSETHECRAFDLPGHGRSAEWDGKGVYQDTVCTQIREMIGDWTAPVDLVGHSFGATAALRVAATTPALVRRLVLIEPVFFGAAYAVEPEFRDRNMRLNGFVDAMEAGDLGGAAKIFMESWGDGRPWEDLPEEQRATFTRQMRLIEAVQETNNGDPERILADGKVAALPMPVLVITGGDSPEGSHKIAAALESMIPDVRTVMIEGAGHMVPITHAAIVGPLVLDFLAEAAVRA